MLEYSPNDLAAFLLAADKHLKRKVTVEMIGGAVAALSFGADSGTGDIDTLTSLQKAAEDAFEAARKETGLQIPVGRVGVSEVPYEYATRLERLAVPTLTNLEVKIPEKHDWALMKITRLLGKDAEDIAEVYGTIGFDKDIFLERFLNEMTHTSGSRSELVYNFLSMMGALYGKNEEERMRQAIAMHKYWQNL